MIIRNHVPRRITSAIVRAMQLSPVQARRWYRIAHEDFDGRTPEAVASTVEGSRILIGWLEARALAVAGR